MANTPVRVGRIAELWRYPIKSMGGESCDSLTLEAAGVAGDRRFAFESADAPPGKPLLGSVQRSAMLRFRAATGADGEVVVATPESTLLPVYSPDLLRDLITAIPQPASLTLLHNEARPFTDVRPIALHSRATEDALRHAYGGIFDPRRLRSNLVLALDGTASDPGDAFPEDRLAGRTLRLGDHAVLQITERIPRCRMVSLEPGTALADHGILRYLALQRAGRAGVYARCLHPGVVRLGDPVLLLPEA